MTEKQGETQRRVVIVNRFFYPDHSATSQIASDLAFFLARQGWSVTAITARQGYSGGQFSAEEFVGGVHVKRVSGTGFGRGTILGRLIDMVSIYPMLFVEMCRHARRGDILIAKTDPPLLSVFAAIAAKLTGARLICWLQDLYPEVAAELGASVLQGWLGAPLRGLRNCSLKSAARCVVIGERMADRVSNLGVARAKIDIVHNWCEDEIIRPVPRSGNPVRLEWGYSPDTLVVGYSGNLGRAHEYQTLLGAAELLLERKDIQFLMVGGGASALALEAEVKSRGLTNFSFHAYQPREKLAQSLGAADVHWLSLIPAMEGLIVPSKAYGIAAAGRPIIAITDQDGEIARLVSAHDAGSVVTPGDGPTLAQTIKRYADDPAWRERQGAAARAMLDQQFTMQAALERWKQILTG
jgi:colanic acid biosynthesis glycosyl transferase WcaI